MEALLTRQKEIAEEIKTVLKYIKKGFKGSVRRKISKEATQGDREITG